ncbi:MAG: acyl carrier protein [Clostridia bacterium]|nr:acyl carrier protein [Clostridia bacterium]
MNVETKIIELIFRSDNLEDYNIDASADIMSINIFEDLGYDSIQFVELIISIEKSFMIEIDDDMLDMSLFSTVQDIVKSIKEMVGNGEEVENG